MSTAVTQGIRITVKSRYLPEQSGPGRWAFAYTVRIENLGSIAAQLRSRHWIITDGNGKREEVKGDGVAPASLCPDTYLWGGRPGTASLDLEMSAVSRMTPTAS